MEHEHPPKLFKEGDCIFQNFIFVEHPKKFFSKMFRYFNNQYLKNYVWKFSKKEIQIIEQLAKIYIHCIIFYSILE